MTIHGADSERTGNVLPKPPSYERLWAWVKANPRVILMLLTFASFGVLVAGLMASNTAITVTSVVLTVIFVVADAIALLRYMEETIEIRVAAIEKQATERIAASAALLTTEAAGVTISRGQLAETVTHLSTAMAELKVTTQAGLSQLADGPDFTRPIRALVSDVLKAQEGGRFPPQERFESNATFRFDLSEALQSLLVSATDAQDGDSDRGTNRPVVIWTIIHHRTEFTLKPGSTDHYAPVVNGLIKPKVVMTESAWDTLKPLMSERWDPFFPVWPQFEHEFSDRIRSSAFRRLPWLNPRAAGRAVDPSAPTLTVTLYDALNDQLGPACVIKFDDVLSEMFPNPNGVSNDARQSFLKAELFADDPASPNDSELPPQLERHLNGILAVSKARRGNVENLERCINHHKPDRLQVVQSLDYLLPVRFSVGANQEQLDRYLFPIDRITQGAEISFTLDGNAPIKFDWGLPPFTPPRLDIRPVRRPEDDGVNYCTLDNRTWAIKTRSSLWLMPGDSIVAYWNWDLATPDAATLGVAVAGSSRAD